MNIDELKKLVKNSNAVLVLDNGEPSFVVMGYKTYKDIASERGGEKEIKINPVRSSLGEVPLGTRASGASETSYGINHNSHEQETEVLERLNKEILALKAQIEMEEKATERERMEY